MASKRIEFDNDEYVLKKRKKKKMRLNDVLSYLCVLLCITYFSSAMLLKAYNLSLNYKITKIQSENSENSKELEVLELEVSALENRATIQKVAEEYGLKHNSENVFYLSEQVEK